MATFTATLANPAASVKTLHAGVQCVSVLATFSGTATASSVFLMARIPNGARIVDYRFYGDDLAANQTYDIGILQAEGSTSGSVTFSQSAIDTALSISGSLDFARVVKNTKLPYKVSISGEATPNNWAWVTCVNSAATSGSAVLQLTIFYAMEDVTY